MFFASVHGYGKLANNTDYFYPGSGNTQNKVNYVAEAETGVPFTKPEIVDVYVTNKENMHISGENNSDPIFFLVC